MTYLLSTGKYFSLFLQLDKILSAEKNFPVKKIGCLIANKNISINCIVVLFRNFSEVVVVLNERDGRRIVKLLIGVGKF